MPRDVIYVPVGRAIIIATPKCGQTAIRRAVGNHAQTSTPELYDQTIAFVRDPLERLESTYHYFAQRGGFPVTRDTRNGRNLKRHPESLEDFINFVLDLGWRDKHWAPQSDLWGLTPTHLHPFEKMPEVMKALGVTVQKINSSGVPKEGIQYRVPELEAYYARDLENRRHAHLHY